MFAHYSVISQTNKHQMAQHIIALRIGSEHGTGHGQSETRHYSSNRTIDEVRSSYAMASAMYDLHLTKQCDNHEADWLIDDFLDQLKAVFKDDADFQRIYDANFGTSDEDELDILWLDAATYVQLYFMIARLIDRDLTWVHTEPDITPHYIGGYGLFYS
jgi:3-phenylpropionate/cinnamic acid dioxygenase small subunit